MSATCRTCNAPVVWTVTAALGKKMPVDAMPVLGGNIALDKTTDPPTAHYVPQESRVFGTARYVSHFVTCKQADQHRKPEAAPSAPKSSKPTKRAERAEQERLAYEATMRGQA